MVIEFRRFQPGDAQIKIVLTRLAMGVAWMGVIFSCTPVFSGSVPSPSGEVMSSASTSDPLCYMETSDGRVLDLIDLCGSEAERSPGTSSQPPVLLRSDRNVEGLQIYGQNRDGSPCYVFDDHGQLCPTP